MNPSKSDAPTITNWKNILTPFNDTPPSHAYSSFPKEEAWRALNQVFTFRTMDTLHGMVSLTRYERQLPRIPLSDFDINDVIRLLRNDGQLQFGRHV